MSESFPIETEIENGIVMGVPNKHILEAVRHTDCGSIKFTAEQNESRLVFYLSRDMALVLAQKILNAAGGPDGNDNEQEGFVWLDEKIRAVNSSIDRRSPQPPSEKGRA